MEGNVNTGVNSWIISWIYIQMKNHELCMEQGYTNENPCVYYVCVCVCACVCAGVSPMST